MASNIFSKWSDAFRGGGNCPLDWSFDHLFQMLGVWKEVYTGGHSRLELTSIHQYYEEGLKVLGAVDESLPLLACIR